MTEKRIAVYPGSFDPFTYGHLDIVEAAAKIFDEVIILIGGNSEKAPLLGVTQRITLISRGIQNMRGLTNVSVMVGHGSTVKKAISLKAGWMIRGIRSPEDMQPEFTLNGVNKLIDTNIETVLLFGKHESMFISSSNYIEFVKLGLDTSLFVPDDIDHEYRSHTSLFVQTLGEL